MERTEGWPAGLYLAALSMQTGAVGSLGGGGFTGDDRFVSEYLRDELLSRVPAEEATFLKYTSVLERMSGGLCDAVLQTTGSAHTLDTLGRANGFVVRLDRRREWYRYHHLFGQLLRNELERNEPDVVAELNRRAMAWCIANDLTEEAVTYGHAAGETSTLANLVEGVLLPLYFDGRMRTAEEWFGWFGEDELVQHPALAVYGAWIRVLTGRPEDAERLLALADGATSTGPLADGSATIEPWIATLRAHMMRDGVEHALAAATLALDRLPPGSWWIPGSLRMRGVAHGLLGAADRETEDLNASIAEAQALGAPATTLPWPWDFSRSERLSGGPGARQPNAHGLHKRSSTRRASVTTRPAHSCTLRRHGSHCTREDVSRRERRSHAPTVCGPRSTTAYPG